MLLLVDPAPPPTLVHAWSTTAPFSSACSTRISTTAASSSSLFLAHKDNQQQQQQQQQKKQPTTSSRQKAALLNSLDVHNTLNAASPERTQWLQELCAVNPTPRPGSTAAWADTVVGEWRVVYAPHMHAMGRLLRGRFAPVIYQMSNDADNNNTNQIVSHARVELPFLGSWWFSVSGTYGSVDQDRVCRVHFDEAWVRRIDVEDKNDTTSSSSPDNDDGSYYYPNIDAVPESPAKEWIRRTGRTLFVEAVAVFPVSYLDHDLVVFDFELLGTRICALKQGKEAS